METVVCNHIRSVLLFIESIKNKNGFHVKRCENNDIFSKESSKIGDEKCIEPVNQMGYFTDESEEGVFYVKTNGEPPYAGKNIQFKRIFPSFYRFLLCLIHNNFEQVVAKDEYRELIVLKIR